MTNYHLTPEDLAANLEAGRVEGTVLGDYRVADGALEVFTPAGWAILIDPYAMRSVKDLLGA